MGWEVVDTKEPEDGEEAVVLQVDSEPTEFVAAEHSNWETVEESRLESLESPAGLQTAEQVGRNFAREKEKERIQSLHEDPAANGRGAETIYRDATGRRVDVALQRAEARKKMEAQEAKKRKEKELGMGKVQQQQKDQRRKLLEEIKTVPFARTADDIAMNKELKAKERWNDPAAAFLSKHADATVNTAPTFKGAAMPNRFGILPGYRWDGVDRSNGFEKQYFMKQNEVKLRQEAAYGWSTEDM